MLLDKNRLRDDRTQAAGTKEPAKRCDDMNEKDNQISHLRILTKLGITMGVPRINNSPGIGATAPEVN